MEEWGEGHILIFTGHKIKKGKISIPIPVKMSIVSAVGITEDLH